MFRCPSALRAVALALLLLGSIAITSGCAPAASSTTSSLADAPAFAEASAGTPITATATRNAPCTQVGELVRGDDGSTLRCVWNNPAPPSNGASGRP
jgi:hypothetical protein